MRLHVDRIACEGRGACVELLPELLRADGWGYPLTTGEREPAVPANLEDFARSAVRHCPRLALKLLE